jgi:hypothetical protein
LQPPDPPASRWFWRIRQTHFFGRLNRTALFFIGGWRIVNRYLKFSIIMKQLLLFIIVYYFNIMEFDELDEEIIDAFVNVIAPILMNFKDDPVPCRTSILTGSLYCLICYAM